MQPSTERALDSLIAAIRTWTERDEGDPVPDNHVELLLTNRDRPGDLCIERWPLTDAQILRLAGIIHTASTVTRDMVGEAGRKVLDLLHRQPDHRGHILPTRWQQYLLYGHLAQDSVPLTVVPQTEVRWLIQLGLVEHLSRENGDPALPVKLTAIGARLAAEVAAVTP